MTDKPTMWERRHKNSWVAVVKWAADVCGHTANAFNLSLPEPQWANTAISDLETAQQIADGRVPAHELLMFGLGEP